MEINQQKYYKFLQKQILLITILSLISGLVYIIGGWIYKDYYLASVWYFFLVIISMVGAYLYREFDTNTMNEKHLARWYRDLKWFMYIIFISWSVIFLMYVGHKESTLHSIAIFTQLGASVVASVLLVSDKKLFVPTLLVLMLPLSGYFLIQNGWTGQIMAIFSLVFLSILLYAAYNTHSLIEKNYYQAQLDPLTGLHNRRYFVEYMETVGDRLFEDNGVAYLYLVDLDHFKTINDSLGHDIGDQLLIEVSERLKKYVKYTHVLARLGGDEFILVSKHIEHRKQNNKTALNFAKNMLGAIRQPYIIDQHKLHISASIGVHQLNASSLYDKGFIKEADIAMYEAKAQGRDGIILFNEQLADKVSRQLKIEQKLHLALKNKEIEVHYQPQFNRASKIVGFEALVRWNDNELGRISPDEFVPVCENTGLILDLGHYILHDTFESVYKWNQKGHVLDSFSINISMRQLVHEPFIEEVITLMKWFFLNKDLDQKILFEITEHVFSEDIKKVVANMHKLKEYGISFSIDDFGTGYSSLSYLRELPIEELKIDRAFIKHLHNSKNDDNMISTIISIAKNFNLSVVAEGVETYEQFEFLMQQGCDIFQGFYFKEALKKDIFEKKYIENL